MTIIYEKEQLSEIIAAVQAGQTIAFPTDTVYGLGVISTDAQALERLKAAKGRPDSKPIPTMVASVEQLRTVACVDERAEKIAEAFLPGALTMVMKRQADLPEYMTNGWETIGVRMPDDAFVLGADARQQRQPQRRSDRHDLRGSDASAGRQDRWHRERHLRMHERQHDHRSEPR